MGRQLSTLTRPGRTNSRESLRPLVPNAVIDITDVVRKKARAMNRFKSQYHGEDGRLQRKPGEVLDGSMHAIHARVPNAKAFVADSPQLCRLSPLSEYEVQVDQRDKQELYDHITQMLLV